MVLDPCVDAADGDRIRSVGALLAAGVVFGLMRCGWIGGELLVGMLPGRFCGDGFVGRVLRTSKELGRGKGQSCERQNGCNGGVCAHMDLGGAKTPEQFLR